MIVVYRRLCRGLCLHRSDESGNLEEQPYDDAVVRQKFIAEYSADGLAVGSSGSGSGSAQR